MIRRTCERCRKLRQASKLESIENTDELAEIKVLI